MSMLEKDLQEIDLDEVEEALDDADDDATAEEDAFEKALMLYKRADFIAAKAAFEKCLGLVGGDGPSTTYIQRCQTYIDQPPESGWDGVFALTEKG